MLPVWMQEAFVIRILIADDHGMVRQSLDLLLSLVKDITVVGQASNGQEALDLCEKVMPDVVLMDILMPEMDGFTATQALRRRYPKIKIIILTAVSNAEKSQAAYQSGAHAFLLKNSSVDQIFETVRAVHVAC